MALGTCRVLGTKYPLPWELEGWVSWSLGPCLLLLNPLNLDVMLILLFKENPGREGKAQKSHFPASWVSPTTPTCQSPAKHVVLDSFPWNHKWETLLWPGGQVGGWMSALLVLPLPLGPFSVLVYTSAKGVEWSFFLQVNFKGMISFQEVLQDPGRNEKAKNSLNFHPCYQVLLLQMTGSTFQGGIQARLAQACCLEHKCEWSTDCLLPNWKCSVGINWQGYHS